jgi:4a-hydroxytetrahydrobiopterin dehydratase
MSSMMEKPLQGRHCTPCRGDVQPLDEAAARAYLGELPDWQLAPDGKYIKRDIRFRSFAEALAFVNEVGAIAEAEGHHPDIAFGWGYASISLHTHKIGGLHENDFIVAARIDGLTRR